MLFPSDAIPNPANSFHPEETEASRWEDASGHESLLQLTLSSIEAGTWDWDILRDRLTWSDRLWELLGYAPGEVPPSLQAWNDRIHPDDLEETHQVLRQALENHKLAKVEYRVIHADGSVHWLLVKGQGFYDASDRPVRMLGIALEMTERKQAELALKKQIEQEYLLNEIAQEIRRSLRVDEVLSSAVHRVRAFLGTDRVIIFRFRSDGGGDVIMESVGSGWTAILSTAIFDPCFHDRYVEAYRQGHIGLMANIDAPNVEPCYVQLLRQFEVKANLVVPILQNERLWGLLIAHECAAPREWKQTEVAAVHRLSTQLGIALQKAELYQQLQLELQEQQQREQKIREQAAALDRAHKLLQLFIRYAPVGIAMFNREMEYVAVSQRWVDQYALDSIESTLNRCHYDIFPEIPEHWKQVHQRCLAGAIEKCDDDRFVREDGTTQWISWEVHPWYQTDQEIGGIIIFSIDVSRLKQSQQDRQASEQQIQRQLAEIEAIYQSAPIGLNVLDRDLRFVRINERLAEINGLSVEEHLGRSVREILPGLVETAEHLLQNIIETGEPLMNVEIRGETPAQPGVERIWLESFLPLKNGDQVIGISTVCEEITERKAAEEALKSAKAELEIRVAERTADLQHSKNRLSLLWNMTQKIRQSLELSEILATATQEARKVLQAERVAVYRFNPDWTGNFIAESVEMGWVKLVESDCQLAWKDTYLQEHQGGRFRNHGIFKVDDIYDSDLEFCHVELLEQIQAKAYVAVPIFMGETLWGLLAIYQNSAPRHWQDQEIELLQQISQQLAIAIHQSHLYNQLQLELKERQQAEAKIRDGEQRWRSLLENVRLLVVVLDPQGTIEYVNPFLSEITGYSSAELLGKNWFETILSPADLATFQSTSTAFLSHQTPTYSILTKAGEKYLIAWNNTILKNASDEVMSIISIGEDITERQKLEEIKHEFIGIVSHELRTPLTAIQMSLGLLHTGVYANNPEKSKRMVEIAFTDTKRLVNLVNDILDLERLESGRALLDKTVCSAMVLMEQSANLMSTIAKPQNISINIVPTQLTVWAAPDSIVQTLANLLSNALKFSPPNSRIDLQAEAQDKEILFQVKDQGRGIPEEKLESIFGRFQQVDASDAREKGGTGLGLSICRSIIERHGGKIWAESAFGRGSTFYFTLPKDRLCSETEAFSEKALEYDL